VLAEAPVRPAPAPALPSPPPPPPEPALPDVSVETDTGDASFDLPEAPPFERPSWSESEPAAPEPTPLEDLAGSDEATPFEPEATPFEPEAPAFEPEAPAFEPEPAMPAVDLEEPPRSPEEMVGGPEADSSPLDQLTEPEASPFGDDLLDAPPVAEEPAPPAWDDIVETCKAHAQASGAMLVDPAGQVFAARGDWPAPGPDAIASKLVTMMAKTLKDAPTRSISAPLMGMHLTAWRVPLSEGLVTVAFIGKAPVRAEARPLIDAEILSGVKY
jgi:hypothetical protein